MPGGLSKRDKSTHHKERKGVSPLLANIGGLNQNHKGSIGLILKHFIICNALQHMLGHMIAFLKDVFQNVFQKTNSYDFENYG